MLIFRLYRQGDPQRMAFLDEIGQLVVNYTALALSSSEVFPQLSESVHEKKKK